MAEQHQPNKQPISTSPADQPIRDVNFGSTIVTGNGAETRHVVCDRSWSATVDWAKRIVWVKYKNSAGVEATVWVPFENVQQCRNVTAVKP